MWKQVRTPQVMIGDRDAKYLADFWQYVTKALGMECNLSTASHQQTDGKVERMIQTVKRTLKPYLDYAGKNWVDLLPILEFTLNKTVNHTKVSPFAVDIGRDPRSPNDWNSGSVMEQGIMTSALRNAKDFMKKCADVEKIVQLRLREEQDKQAAAYNKGRRAEVFAKGTLVKLKRDGIDLPALRKLPEKMKQEWLGPFAVECEGPHPDTYRLALSYQIGGVYPVFHVSILRKSLEKIWVS